MLPSDKESWLKHLSPEIERIVNAQAADLVDVEIAGSKTQPILRILVHREPAVPLKMCEVISKEIADYLDVEDPIPGRYRLEVTSPGLGRPLVTDADFSRAKNRIIKIISVTGNNKRGRLQHFNEQSILLETQKGRNFEVLRSEIAKATIEVEFNK